MHTHQFPGAVLSSFDVRMQCVQQLLLLLAVITDMHGHAGCTSAVVLVVAAAAAAIARCASGRA